MIDISKPHCSLVRVEKIISTELTKTYQIGHDLFQNDENKDYIQRVNRFNPNICECFYSSHVVIVEGDTEAIICREILNNHHGTEDIFVLNSGSKNNMSFFQRILNHFNIPYTVIHDSDYRHQYKDKELVLKLDGSPKDNSAWTLNQKIWDEIENGKEKGINVHRLVSVHDFEIENGYEYNKIEGKPLSAYKFAKQNSSNELPIFNFIYQIAHNKYEKDWSPSDFDVIPEPHMNE